MAGSGGVSQGGVAPVRVRARAKYERRYPDAGQEPAGPRTRKRLAPREQRRDQREHHQIHEEKRVAGVDGRRNGVSEMRQVRHQGQAQHRQEAAVDPEGNHVPRCHQRDERVHREDPQHHRPAGHGRGGRQLQEHQAGGDHQEARRDGHAQERDGHRLLQQQRHCGECQNGERWHRRHEASGAGRRRVIHRGRKQQSSLDIILEKAGSQRIRSSAGRRIQRCTTRMALASKWPRGRIHDAGGEGSL